MTVKIGGRQMRSGIVPFLLLFIPQFHLISIVNSQQFKILICATP